MKKFNNKYFINSIRKRSFLFAICCIFLLNVQSQTCPLVTPSFFGIPGNFIFCQNKQVPFGVFNSSLVTGQQYVFSVYRGGEEVSRKAGPLDGNGGQLSVAAYMRSAADQGEYRITSFNNCADTARIKFQAFYNSIDNLSITNWGAGGVNFIWAACGPLPAVTYEYVVTTQSNPTIATGYQTTTDTTASATGLTDGVTYYIHVRIKSVIWNAQNVVTASGCTSTVLPFQTLKFISCSTAATVAPIDPLNAISCTGSSVTFTATGGNTYQWYDDNNVLIGGAASQTYSTSVAGHYKVYITTSTGCEGIISSATLTQTAIQTGTFSGGGCFNIGDSVKLAIRGSIIGQTYTLQNDGVDVITLDGIGKSFESGDTIWYKFKFESPLQLGTYTVRTGNPYCTAVDFGSEPVSGPGSWSGNVDTNWLNVLNWKCGSVPDANTDVVIAASAAHFPIINSNVSCKSLLVKPGATITTATGFTLDITGQ